jgi:hypothetical protein
MGSDCERQKLLLHWLQDGEEELPFARRDILFSSRRRSLSSMMLLMSSSSSAAAMMSSRPARLRASWSS